MIDQYFYRDQQQSDERDTRINEIESMIRDARKLLLDWPFYGDMINQQEWSDRKDAFLAKTKGWK